MHDYSKLVSLAKLKWTNDMIGMFDKSNVAEPITPNIRADSRINTIIPLYLFSHICNTVNG